MKRWCGAAKIEPEAQPCTAAQSQMMLRDENHKQSILCGLEAPCSARVAGVTRTGPNHD